MLLFCKFIIPHSKCQKNLITNYLTRTPLPRNVIKTQRRYWRCFTLLDKPLPESLEKCATKSNNQMPELESNFDELNITTGPSRSVQRSKLVAQVQ